MRLGLRVPHPSPPPPPLPPGGPPPPSSLSSGARRGIFREPVQLAARGLSIFLPLPFFRPPSPVFFRVQPSSPTPAATGRPGPRPGANWPRRPRDETPSTGHPVPLRTFLVPSRLAASCHYPPTTSPCSCGVPHALSSETFDFQPVGLLGWSPRPHVCFSNRTFWGIAQPVEVCRSL